MTLAEELRSGLSKGIVQFSYEKKNGEWREALGTRNPEGLEAVEGTAPKGTGTEKTGYIAYWDINSKGWRSFSEDKIIAVNKILTVEEYQQNTNL